MNHWSDNISAFYKQNKDDLEYLLFVGMPVGIVLIVLTQCMDFTRLY